jgi:hypothetical protein
MPLRHSKPRWVFGEFGAVPDLARVQALSRKPAAKPAGGMTARGLEALRLVATDETNRSIAADLLLSEKTVRGLRFSGFVPVPRKAATSAWGPGARRA